MPPQEQPIVDPLQRVPTHHKPVVRELQQDFAQRAAIFWIRSVVVVLLASKLPDVLFPQHSWSVPHWLFGIGVVSTASTRYVQDPPQWHMKVFLFHPSLDPSFAAAITNWGSAFGVVGFVTAVYEHSSISATSALLLIGPGWLASVVGCALAESATDGWKEGRKKTVASMLSLGGMALSSAGFVVMIYLSHLQHKQHIPVPLRLPVILVLSGTAIYLLCFMLNETYGWRQGVRGACVLSHMYGSQAVLCSGLMAAVHWLVESTGLQFCVGGLVCIFFRIRILGCRAETQTVIRN